jgi:DNA replicative helicase MCM subunit Mcm2 (Cdc46/Mcm family)
MRARTAVIAAANPSLGRYDVYKSVFENLPKFPPSLFSRFDLIFKVLDVPNEENDMNVVKHIMESSSRKSPIDRVLLRKYIAFSKRIKPTISVEAIKALENYFVAVRKNYTTDQKVFPFSFRQFEALKRLTLARARALLKEEADIEDVTAMKRLFDVFLHDTIGGDVTSVECGMDSGKRTSENIRQIILKILQNPTSKEDVRNQIGCETKDFEKMWKWLTEKCIIYEQSYGLFKANKQNLSDY